jgi:hypothetical protein
MTMTQVEKRLAALERRLTALQESLDYQQAVDGIRRGLESADRGERRSVAQVCRKLRRRAPRGR